MESFNHMTRLGDVFLQQLKDTGEDMSNMFAFTEFIEVIDQQKVPQEGFYVNLYIQGVPKKTTQSEKCP